MFLQRLSELTLDALEPAFEPGLVALPVLTGIFDLLLPLVLPFELTLLAETLDKSRCIFPKYLLGVDVFKFEEFCWSVKSNFFLGVEV